MAQVTPLDILKASEAAEKAYADMVDDLLVNIAKHFKNGQATPTAMWEIKKLAELGKLTEESAKIIAKHSGVLVDEVERAMWDVARKANLDVDPQLALAQRSGILAPNHMNTLETSPAMQRLIESYVTQSADKMNLTNATLLNSVQTSYVNAVHEVAMEEAQSVLNQEAFGFATNAKTRREAIRSATQKMSDKGLTGFIDRAGRHWHADTYAAMVVRTAAHNVAIESVRERQKEYGSDIFQVSAHGGARPLCYPWQNKFVSWESPSGKFTDGAGHEHEFVNINETSYGEPAGLFGINCGHFPRVVIPNYTIPHDMPEQDPEENRKAYEESQVQRQYERNIRQAKRELDIAEATGDTEAAKAAKAKLKNAQANMRQFIDETGRKRQYDRERVIGGRGGTQAHVEPATPTKPRVGKLGASELGNEIGKSLSGEEMDSLLEVLNDTATDEVRWAWGKYGGDLREVKRSKNNGWYTPSKRKIEWSKPTDKRSEWQTLAHEFGHHTDTLIGIDNINAQGKIFESTEVDALFGATRTRWVPKVASTSDEFLAAMRADRDALSFYVGVTDEAKAAAAELHKVLVSAETTTIQDAFDGWWGTRSYSWADPLHLPFGHGEKYYNRTYNNAKDFDDHKRIQKALKGLGFDASNQAKVKRIMRDYEAASELWANIQGVETVGGASLETVRKYMPNAVSAYEEIMRRAMGNGK